MKATMVEFSDSSFEGLQQLRLESTRKAQMTDLLNVLSATMVLLKHKSF